MQRLEKRFIVTWAVFRIIPQRNYYRWNARMPPYANFTCCFRERFRQERRGERGTGGSYEDKSDDF